MRSHLTDQFFTVTQLAQELGVTARAIRFYEDKGLIAPGRAGSTRIYTHRDRARMILILRGKRLGFSLREIRDYLDLYKADPGNTEQARALLVGLRKRITQLEEQRAALDQTLAELCDAERQTRHLLDGAALPRRAAG